MQDSFTRIYSIVRQIPPGQVSSYGTIAALAGNPRWSRVVGYAMRACRDPAVPCHRVLYQDGTLSPAFFENGENGVTAWIAAKKFSTFFPQKC